MKEELRLELNWLEETIDRVVAQAHVIAEMVEGGMEKVDPFLKAIDKLRREMETLIGKLELEEEVKEQEAPTPLEALPEPPVSPMAAPKPTRSRKEKSEAKED